MFYVTLYAPGQKHPDYTEQFEADNFETVLTYIAGTNGKLIDGLPVGMPNMDDIKSCAEYEDYQDNSHELKDGDRYTGWTLVIEGSPTHRVYRLDPYGSAKADIIKALVNSHDYARTMSEREYRVLERIARILRVADDTAARVLKNMYTIVRR